MDSPAHAPYLRILAVTTIAVLIFLAVWFFGGSRHAIYDLERKKTQEIQRVIALGFTLSSARTGKRPASLDPIDLSIEFGIGPIKGKTILDDLIKLSAYPLVNGHFVDGWGRPLSITQEGERIYIQSSGRDGAANTRDDLLVTWPNTDLISPD